MEESNKITPKLAVVSVLIATVLTGISVAFGYFIWNSTNNTNISFTVEGAMVYLDDGADITGANLVPVKNYTSEGAVRKSIKIKLKDTPTDNVTVTMTLHVNSIDSGLNHESFKWTLVKPDGTTVGGNFKSAVSGTTDIALASLSSNAGTLTTDLSKYDLYIWIDGNNENPDTMQNQSFDFTLNVVGTDSSLKYFGTNIVESLDDGSTGDSGSGVYKVEHEAIGADVSVTGEKIPASTDYRYYGANPNNYVLLPDMDVEDGSICTYNGEIVTSFAGCNTIYKEDCGNGEVYYYDEWYANKIVAGPGSMTWDSTNNQCLYNGEGLMGYNASDSTTCSKLSVINIQGMRKYAVLVTNLGAGTKEGSSKTGLYRIIGSSYDELTGTNRLRVIKAIPINDGNTGFYAWDLKSNGSFENIWATPTSTINSITNNYSNNTTSGSTLMQLLNSGAWWNGTTGTYYEWNNNNSSSPNSINLNYTGKGLSSSAKEVVDISRYYLAEAYPGNESQNGLTMYKMERTGVRSDNKKSRYDGKRPLYWEGNVGLMYPSDYVFAAGNTCSQNIGIYYENCYKKDWLFIKHFQWLQSPYSGGPDYAWGVYPGGDVGSHDVGDGDAVRPVLSLKSDVIFSSGEGNLNNPYIITR